GEPNPVDVHVGRRLRFRRTMIGMSQEKLGNELGLTFQQIQKYEKGTNRIGASRLYDIARILGVAVQFFFEDLPATGPSQGLDTSDSAALMDFVGSPEGHLLIASFAAIRDQATRRRIIDLVRALAGGTEAVSKNGA
ncbi:MAG TPA: helix-turn-helix transcriptional regulator, partial [Paracoccaceae bacterium]|nr:helix-turn-helix transcriptional regulator [Paracoccaceae bacterium]